MSFKKRVYLLALSIFFTLFVLLATLSGFSYYLVNKTTAAYQQGERLTQTINTAREAHINFQRQVQEWKNTLIRGHDKPLYNKYFSSFQDKEKLMDSKLVELTVLLKQQGLNDLAARTNTLIHDHAALGKKYRQALQTYPTLDWKGQQSIDVMVRGIDRPTSEGIDNLVVDIEQNVATQFAQRAEDIRANTLKSLLLMGALVLLMSALLLGLLYKLMRDLIAALGAEPERAVAATARIAKGDLTEELQASSPSSLIGSLEMMQLRLRNISLAITASADEVREQAATLSNSDEREMVNSKLSRLYDAIARIKTSR